ncbi:MAG: hypothetical protein RBU36_13855 [Thermoanaerobaculia bacterium]|jgi:hypothetical protein|nr:hypothetical protein [Thermoanaerobaculia bacterium]
MSDLSSRKALLALLGVLLVALVYRYWPGGGTVGAGPSARGARPGVAARAGEETLLPGEIPPLALGTGRGEVGGAVVRNVFAFHVPPTPTPKPLPPTPTPFPRPGSVEFIGPRLPTPTPTATPIVPPAIPFRALGIFGPNDRPIVTFEDGPRLINAREGDILDGRYILRRVGRESVDFAFVGLPPEITRRIPVLPPDASR